MHDSHESSINFHNTSDCTESAKKEKNGVREVTGVIYEMQRCCDRKLGQVKGSADTNFNFDMCVFHRNEKKFSLYYHELRNSL